MAIVRSPHAHAEILAVDLRGGARRPRACSARSTASSSRHSRSRSRTTSTRRGSAATTATCAASRSARSSTSVSRSSPSSPRRSPTRAPPPSWSRSATRRCRRCSIVEAALAPGAPLLYEEWGTNVMFAGTAGDGDFEQARRPRRTDRRGRAADRPLDLGADRDRAATSPTGTRARSASPGTARRRTRTRSAGCSRTRSASRSARSA